MWQDEVGQLLRYPGIGAKPWDFDTFWDASIAQMHALGADCTRIKAHFSVPGVKAYELYFEGVDHAQIHCRYVCPENTTVKRPAVCLFHGYTVDCGSFTMMLPFVAAGFCVLGMTARGQGDGSSFDSLPKRGNVCHLPHLRGLSENDPAKLYYRDVYLDAAQAARILMAQPEVDSSRIITMGGSQGGGLALACAALEPNVFRTVAAAPFLCDWQGAYEDGATITELDGWFIHCDPMHKKEQEIFRLLSYVDVRFLAPRIRSDVLMATGLKDTTVLPKTQFSAYNAIQSNKKLIIYPDMDHAAVPDLCDEYMEFICNTEEKHEYR